jgi:hypothetical protein
LSRVLRLVFSRYVDRRTGEVTVRLRREEARWAVDYEARDHMPRPPEARGLPVRVRGTAADTFLALHEASRDGLRGVGVSPGGAMRVELAVHLEDGRMEGWELRGLERVREGRGGGRHPLSTEAVAGVTRVLLAFTEGLGARTLRLVLRAEHRLGEEEARVRVVSAQVERVPPAPELSWYRAMHEATLLRWREGVVEGSAWLARKGVEEMAVWFAGGIIAQGAGFFATQGLKWVPKALGRGPESAAGWLRTTMTRLPGEDRRAFEQLWLKVRLEGEKALTRHERNALRRIFERLEQIVSQPLSDDHKNKLRGEARKYYGKLHPHLDEVLKKHGSRYPIHHRRPLEHAHRFPADDINSADNLAMVARPAHDRISDLWGRFRRAKPDATAEEVMLAAEKIDEHFWPWFHQIHAPAGHSLQEATEAALRALRKEFPGL